MRSPVVLAVDFFNHLNMLYGTVTEFCTPQEVRFPLFSAPPESESMARITVPDYVRGPSVRLRACSVITTMLRPLN